MKLTYLIVIGIAICHSPDFQDDTLYANQYMGEPLPTPYYHREAPVCGINGVTYKSKAHCPVAVAY